MLSDLTPSFQAPFAPFTQYYLDLPLHLHLHLPLSTHHVPSPPPLPATLQPSSPPSTATKILVPLHRPFWRFYAESLAFDGAIADGVPSTLLTIHRLPPQRFIPHLHLSHSIRPTHQRNLLRHFPSPLFESVTRVNVAAQGNIVRAVTTCTTTPSDCIYTLLLPRILH